MGDSYRIRTQVGINKTINIQLDQDYEFLEILSLKIQQSEIYNRNCSDYGVLVGRVTANNGLGIPNAKVSLFVPIDSVDESNPIIQSIYPYKSPEDKNEDGYRYNLLPYEKSYESHAATGTFPSRIDALTAYTAVYIYDKYYKFTAKTNESGDYMIMGIPLGFQTIVMDVDLSDIGEFSLTPQDLIRMGLATETQVSGDRFRTSEDLNSLPQIINLTKSIDISPFWGDPNVCEIAVNRLDFDLRNEANIDIQPTAIFMGSIYSSPDNAGVKPGSQILNLPFFHSKVNANLGNLCQLTTGPGQILAIRQTIVQDNEGNPILEQHRLDNSGNVIDTDGTWVVELPMNLEYVITNEFGEKIISYDPTIGIPTKAKYRFKIKWQQPNTLSQQTRRPYYLVPNIREYGWVNPSTDPNTLNNTDDTLGSSYYFGLEWSGYTNGFFGSRKQQRIQDIINCDDSFYEFYYNKVYTVSSLIDQYSSISLFGNVRSSFIGIKQIQNPSCRGNINTYPVNEGFQNFVSAQNSFGFYITYAIMLSLLVSLHLIFSAITLIMIVICGLTFGLVCNNRVIKGIKLPMISYPSCESCKCDNSDILSESLGAGTNGVLTFVSNPDIYSDKLSNAIYNQSIVIDEDVDSATSIFSQAIAGNTTIEADQELFKAPKSGVVTFSENNDKHFAYSDSLTLGERINIFNTRPSYFSGVNKIGVTFSIQNNPGKIHYDNTLTLLSNRFYESGQLLTSVDPLTTSDPNVKVLTSAVTNGITGTTISSPSIINVSYATSQLQNSSPVSYNLPTGSTITTQAYPMDREYYQVVTAITVSQAITLWNTGSTQSFPNILNKVSEVYLAKKGVLYYSNTDESPYQYNPFELIDNVENKYILILQRGVDPYSPKYVNEYKIGNILGLNTGDIVFTANTRINIPIQKLDFSNRSVQEFNQNEMFYPSYFFTPGDEYSGYSSTSLGYYGALDAQYNYPSSYLNDVAISGVQSLISKTSNSFFSSLADGAKYDLSEDVSGASFIYFDKDAYLLAAFSTFSYGSLDYHYYTPSAYLYFKDNPISLFNKSRNVMRTDRLPSSDKLNGESWETNPALLQQNNNFTFYTISETNVDGSISWGESAFQQESVDINGLPYSNKIIETFGCSNMVDLDCYEGFGSSFRINPKCLDKEDKGIFSQLGTSVQNGCYVFLRRPGFDLGKDLDNLAEWYARYNFMNALCQQVISQSFTNNWVNGSLFTYPIQVTTKFNSNNQPVSKYPNELIYFDRKTSNFYYRSSPYLDLTDKFIGRQSTGINQRNLLFPTTIVDLGIKSKFYQELIFEAYAKSFIIPYLTSTSYGETSDLVNFFAISRLINSGFLQNLFQVGGSSVNSLFDRNPSSPYLRVDADLVQLMSINSEIGVQKFSTEFYDIDTGVPPVQVLSNGSDSVMAVWFSSNTEDLQIRDYLTPGSLNFTSNNGQNSFNFVYGIKSQIVPFYRWGLNGNNIFGSQSNNWRTSMNDIFSKKYQSLDRTQVVNPGYFQSSTIPQNNLSLRRGYIFSTDENGVYSDQKAMFNDFLVGAPFHFYFGIKEGATAIDKFKSKYLSDE